MRFAVSAGLLSERPGFMDLVERTALTCQEMDPDIVTDSLLVEARRHPRKTRFQGWAHPEYWSIFRGTSRIHMDGRIQIVVGDRVRTTDVIRVIAHELRHIGQFHRGQELTGETHPGAPIGRRMRRRRIRL